MEYLIHLAILIGIYVILSESLNLVVGYAGLLSVTHAAFYGIGAYATAICMTSLGVNFFLSLLIGIAVSVLVSVLMGFVLSRFRDDYYALASLGFNVIAFSVFLNWNALTGGAFGIPGIERPNFLGVVFSSPLAFLLLVAICVALVHLFSKFIVDSSFGRALKGIREDEEALRVFGYETHFYKLIIFAIGAGLAALAGSLYASYITYIDPTGFTINESIFILVIIILGGLANLKGSIAGAIVLVLLPELLRFIGMPNEIAAQMRQLIYGAMLVLLMLYRPKGFLGEYRI